MRVSGNKKPTGVGGIVDIGILLTVMLHITHCFRRSAFITTITVCAFIMPTQIVRTTSLTTTKILITQTMHSSTQLDIRTTFWATFHFYTFFIYLINKKRHPLHYLRYHLCLTVIFKLESLATSTPD